MATEAETRVMNQTYCDMLDGGMLKEAQSEGSEYIRLKLREQGFGRKIIPTEPVGNDIDRALWTDKPMKFYDKETDVPASVSVGYNTRPVNFYIQPSRFAVTPTMLMSPKVMKNRWELRTYKFDVKQVFADNMVKDLQAEEDRALLAAVNTALIGAGSTMPASGVAQYQNVAGGFSRTAVNYAVNQIVPATFYNIPVETVLINNLTWYRGNDWFRDEVGGSLSEETLVKGFMRADIFNKNWLITLKRRLVPNMSQFMFGPASFLGKSVQFTEPTMYVEVKPVEMYMFYCVEELGTTLAHTGAFGRADYLAA